MSWFAIETFGWAANLLPDDIRMRENRPWFPHKIVVKRTEAQRVPVRQTATTSSATSPSTEVCSDNGCRVTAHLDGSDWKDRAVMAVMALSMGYMFYGMELLAMAMPPMP